MIQMPSKVLKRFWRKVNKQESCWLWTGTSLSKGYGLVRNECGKNQGSHRFSWRIHFGEIPDGLSVLHKCDNPLCVNPDHLFLGTQQENLRDMVNKNRQASGDDNGARKRIELMPRGVKHGMAVLDDWTVRYIRERYRPNDPSNNIKAIALDLGVGKTTVRCVVARRTWKHVA